MILSPAVIALNAGSLTATVYAVYGAGIGLKILRFWNPHSGSERQILMERQTCLVTTLFSFFAAWFLLVHTADRLHLRISGAMCAVGVFNANAWGWSALLLKVFTFMACGVWEVVNHTDSRCPDYPLIRLRYSLIIIIAGLMCAETLMQIRFFAALDPAVITSCCSAVFNPDARTFGGILAGLPPKSTETVFFISGGLAVFTGIFCGTTGRIVKLFSVTGGIFFLITLASVASFISVRYYELPTHHCPFCLLQPEYDYIGYALYISLFTGGIAGTGAGILNIFRRAASLDAILPGIQKKLCCIGVLAWLIVMVIAAWPAIFSDFVIM